MSQRSEKLRRQVDILKERMDFADSRVAALELSFTALGAKLDRWAAAEAAVHNQAVLAAAERNAERRRARKAEREAKTWKLNAYLTLLLLVLATAIFLAVNAEADDAEPIDPPVVATVGEAAVEAAVGPEEAENERIEAALLARANVIESCEVTWYTEDTCGKTPDDPAYGITRSGLPVVEHLTCAVDPEVIPMYSDVFVEYADGTIEQLWATDTGVKGKSLDIYTPDYDYAIQCGRQHLTVWWMGPED